MEDYNNSDRQEIFSKKIRAGKRTYFIDLKEKQNGDRVLKITESRKNEGEFIRSTVMIFQEDFEKFFASLDIVKRSM
jgi:hypothetical protein